MLGPSSLDDYNLIFGSQILDFDVEWATELRSTLLQAPSLEWILDVLRTLPKQWCVIADQAQVLQSYTEGHSHLDALALWIRTGDFEHITLPLPNILLTPLVVATHFAQYGRFLEVLDPSGRHLDRLQSSVKQSCGIVGFCTGQLSAAVISHSSTWADFRRYGAAAIRSAMAIGAVVDATNSDCWKSLVVASNRSEVNDTIGPTLDHFSEVA